MSEHIVTLTAGEESEPRNQFIVSTVKVERHGAHDHVRVWSRGGYAGYLIVSAGDGADVAARLLPPEGETP